MADDLVDALYALPLNEFVAARNALAKELKQPDIRQLKKPSTTAWVLNQLARTAADEVDALLAAGRKVAESQAGAVRGRGSAPFREAVQAERDALSPLLTKARKLVKGEGPVLKVADALRAAAAAPTAGEALREGRLTEEPELGAFGGFEAAPPIDTDDRDHDADEKAERKARLEERRKAEKDTETAEREAARAEARADEAEQRAAQLRAEADEARRRADASARRLAELS